MPKSARWGLVLLMRFAGALALAAALLFVQIQILRIAPVLSAFGLLVLPICIIGGFLPLLRWYRRDAYPIGLAFFPIAFFLMRHLASVTGH